MTLEHDADFATIVRQLLDVLAEDNDALGLWTELQDDVGEEFRAHRGFAYANNWGQDNPQAFVSAVHNAIVRRSQRLAGVQVKKRQEAGEVISPDFNIFAIISEEAEANTPDYQRRRRLYNAARQIVGLPAV